MIEFPTMNIDRVQRQILTAVNDFNLSLDGACVLTEAASGVYAVTPLIAAVAGAMVHAVAKDSRYGSADEVVAQVAKYADLFGVSARIRFHKSASSMVISESNIVTNLGHLRPIDTSFIKAMNETSVIPLMWEPWEFRNEDLDIQECRNRGIPVLGTNESSQHVQTFEYIGMLIEKLLLDAGSEIVGNKIALVGSGVFLKKARDRLHSAGAAVNAVDVSVAGWRDAMISYDADAVVMIEHINNECIIGSNGIMSHSIEFWKNRLVIHVCGHMDSVWCREYGATLIPEKPAGFGRMSYTTAHLGPLPVIKLHTAGLKVGEMMWRARVQGMDGSELEKWVSSRAPAMGF